MKNHLFARMTWIIVVVCYITYGFQYSKKNSGRLNGGAHLDAPNHLDQGSSETLDPSFDQYFLDHPNFSGNVLVALKGEPIFQKSYGYANIELQVKNSLATKFRIGSITKQFTAMAIMILEEQGKLSTTDKISDHLLSLLPHWQNLTIHHLLTHTSGLPHTWTTEGFTETMMLPNSMEETIDRFKNQPLLASPGEEFHYSGVGYFLLAAIIQEISGKSYEAFLNEQIFSKIGMQDTGADGPQKIIQNRAAGYETDTSGIRNAPYIYMPILTGGGNLYSTLGDLLKWDRALHENTLITKETKEKMFTANLNNYGYGWFVRKTDSSFRVDHTGGVAGFNAFIGRYPNEELLIVILSNHQLHSIREILMNFSGVVIEELEKTGYNKK